MPHRKKKPFIEKKKAVTFHLVHRSQRDPLAADETAPQRVLLPADKAELDKRKEEQRNFGVFFDDDYNYLQHLKEVGPGELVPSDVGQSQRQIIVTEDGEEEAEVEHIPAPSINLPSSVFASEFEEDIGLLNKAAPVGGLRLDLDPDIVAGLDDDFDFDDPENQLDDDFIIQANDPSSNETWRKHEGEWEDVDSEEEDDDSQEGDFDSDGPVSDEEGGGESGNTKEFFFMNEETKSRFTDYSISSSVIKRNDQLTLLDERFEKFYEQFDDDEIGALDNAELEGFIRSDSNRLQDVIEDYYKQKAKECVKLDDRTPREGMDMIIEEVEEDNEEMETVVVEEPGEKWDCESFLSTYSNLYNHPQMIKEPTKSKPIVVSSKTGMPLGVLPARGLTAKQVERMEMINGSDLPRVSTQQRYKTESTDERKARKQAIKEERKERRIEKKANKQAFKVEKSRQEKEQRNLQQNLKGIKLS
ncbi:protein LTV1 homolog [Pelobates fuscus]|uniref:protein LTV1 homolog n=1 Tax=Pelobates fuscus TaxID=191477 RepID=UPI002FE472AB